MLDVDGLSLTPADRDLLREPAVGGVILFSRNYESPEQVADLIADIRALRRPPLLIAVDHEGGRVQRFREGFTHMPPMRRIGSAWNKDRDHAVTLARQAAGEDCYVAGSVGPCLGPHQLWPEAGLPSSSAAAVAPGDLAIWFVRRGRSDLGRPYRTGGRRQARQGEVGHPDLAGRRAVAPGLV